MTHESLFFENPCTTGPSRNWASSRHGERLLQNWSPASHSLVAGGRDFASGTEERGLAIRLDASGADSGFEPITSML